MLLAVDTSTAQVGLALYDGSQVIGEYAWRSRQRHTVELAPAVFELLTRCGLTMDDVSPANNNVSVSSHGNSPIVRSGCDRPLKIVKSL